MKVLAVRKPAVKRHKRRIERFHKYLIELRYAEYYKGKSDR
jgi:hypothetical protein